MHISTLLGIAATLCTLFTETTARKAILVRYNEAGCKGARMVCDVEPRTCCLNYQNFRSGRCQGCSKNDYNAVWKAAKGLQCGANCDLRKGNICAGCPGARGHSWAVGSASKRDLGIDDGLSSPSLTVRDDATGTQENPAACTNTVLPNRFSKDGVTWFKINHGVPANVTNAIVAWGLDDSKDMADVPHGAWAYQAIAKRDFDELEDELEEEE